MTHETMPANVGSNDQLGPTAPKPRAWLVAGHLLDFGIDEPAIWTREPTAADHETWAQCGAVATVTPLWGLTGATVAIMDTRTSLAVCAVSNVDFPALYALQGHRVALVDLGPNVEANRAPVLKPEEATARRWRSG